MHLIFEADGAFAPAARIIKGHSSGDIVIETQLMIISGLTAIVIALIAVVGKLRSNTRELNRSLWVQWRRG